MRRRYISPITAEERMANNLLRTAKRLERLGVACPLGQAELDELKAERDRLRQLRGYGSKQSTSGKKSPQPHYDWVTDLHENWDKPRGLAIREWLIEQLTLLQERGFKPQTKRRE
jgi:hypothetical protein